MPEAPLVKKLHIGIARGTGMHQVPIQQLKPRREEAGVSSAFELEFVPKVRRGKR